MHLFSPQKNKSTFRKIHRPNSHKVSEHLDIRLANVPFINNPHKSKDRPVVVIGHPDKKHTMILPITSKFSHKAYSAKAARFPIGYNKHLHLNKESYIDTDNLMTLPNKNVRFSRYGYLGHLTKQQSITVLRYGAKFQQLSSKFYATRNTNYNHIHQYKHDAHNFKKHLFSKYHGYHFHKFNKRINNPSYILPKAKIGGSHQSWSGRAVSTKTVKPVSFSKARNNFLHQTQNNHNQALLSAFRTLRIRRQNQLQR